MNRRNFLTVSSAAAFTACSPNIHTKSRPRLAVTMDDFNLGFDTVLTPVERNREILSVFERFDHKAAGFITGRFIDNDFGKEIASTWDKAGHLIGNHSYSHLNSTDEDVALIKADILKNDALLSGYPHYKKYFRFPYLAEGGKAEKVNDYRKFLTSNGFKLAPVTIDSIDWYTSSRFEARLRQSPKMDVSQYREYYVQSVLALSTHFQTLAESLNLGQIPHLLLMHHNILNGLFLDDVLKTLQDHGWGFVDASEALSHSFYETMPQTPIRGRSLLSVMALEAGIKDTGFPKPYYRFGEKTMDALGL